MGSASRHAENSQRGAGILHETRKPLRPSEDGARRNRNEEWEQFDSLELRKTGKDQFKATISYLDKSGKMERREFSGTPEEIRKTYQRPEGPAARRADPVAAVAEPVGVTTPDRVASTFADTEPAEENRPTARFRARLRHTWYIQMSPRPFRWLSTKVTVSQTGVIKRPKSDALAQETHPYFDVL